MIKNSVWKIWQVRQDKLEVDKKGGLKLEGSTEKAGCNPSTLQPRGAWRPDVLRRVSCFQAVKGLKIEVKPELTDILKTKTGG